jgi:hypothetical protein
MKKNTAISVVAPEDDSTLPSTPITIKGSIYKMCFDLRALGKAERELVALGHDVRLLEKFPRLEYIDEVLILFAAAIRTFQPEISFEEALALPDLPGIYLVRAAIYAAWSAAIPEPVEGEKKNPIEPGSEQS